MTTVSRLRFMGVRAAGTNIALLGGLIATIALITPGIVGWILSVPEVVASTPVLKALNFLNFLLGGTVFAVGFGLLAAGVSVTCYFMRLLPRWLVAFGMLLALTETLLPQPRFISGKILIPATRYLGFIWMFSVGWNYQRSQRSAARLGQRHRIDHVSGTLVLADHPASLASFSCGFRRLLGVRPSQTLLHISLPRCHRRTQAPCTRPSGTTLNASVS